MVLIIQVWQAASQLATVSQAVAEDKELSAVGQETKVATSFRDWDDNILQTGCLNNNCGVHIVEPSPENSSFKKTGSSSSSLQYCSECGQQTCTACMSGPGSAILFRGSSSRGPPLHMEEITLCKRCAPGLVNDAVLLDRVRVLSSARRRSRVKAAAIGALKVLKSLGSWRTPGSTQEDIQEVLRGETSLADYPYATILTSVQTAEGSEPPQSLLSPWSTRLPATYWRAPEGVTMVEFCVALASPAVVSTIVLLVSPCGFTSQDLPMVDIWYGYMMMDKERKYLGRWNIQEAIEKGGAQHAYGPAEDGKMLRQLRYKLPAPVQCRLIWFKLTLSISSPVVPDFLSFDHSSPPLQSVTPYIHAKRIMVLGKQLLNNEDVGVNPHASERNALRNMLEMAPRFSRLRVQVEERPPGAGGRIVELVALMTSTVAGFRLDAPAAIRYAAKYTMSAFNDGRMLDHALCSCIDDLFVNPAILRIRVRAIQDTRQPVPVGEYMIPIARAGMPLYFDFQAPIVVKALTFELLGDVSAFSDEGDQGDLEGKDSPLALSLSLVNRVRVYRYVSTTELGKWPQLNVV
jgi:hypothetical protein